MSYRLVLFVACILAVALAAPARAAIFVNIDGIPGDVTVQGYEGQIEALSLSFSGGPIVPKAGLKVCAAPPMKTQISAITLEKVADAASPKLFLTAGQGKIFGSITITIVVPAGEGIREVAVYTLTNAFISRYEASSAGDRPSETVSLSFGKLQFKSINSAGVPEEETWNFCGI
jgi:type VI secretion system secreted protein Hcp